MSHEPIEQAEVHKLASLARLDLTPAEERAVSEDLERILGHVDKLVDAHDESAASTCHAIEVSSPLRPDEVAPSLPVDLALANAPERLGDGFGVPKILE